MLDVEVAKTSTTTKSIRKMMRRLTTKRQVTRTQTFKLSRNKKRRKRCCDKLLRQRLKNRLNS